MYKARSKAEGVKVKRLGTYCLGPRCHFIGFCNPRRTVIMIGLYWFVFIGPGLTIKALIVTFIVNSSSKIIFCSLQTKKSV